MLFHHRSPARLFEPFRELERTLEAIHRVARDEVLSVEQTEDRLELRLEAPGISAEDIVLEVDGRRLELSFEPPGSKAVEGERYQLRERRTKPFERTLELPWEVDIESVEARLDLGILSVVLPRAASAGARRVAITSSP
jgi:HSP20 family protein